MSASGGGTGTGSGGAGPARRRARWVPVALFVAFVAMPVLEIWVILQVGAVIGGWWTVILLVLDSLVGAWLVRREGARSFRSLQEALGRGAMPGREIADGAMVLVGGALMLTPGFVTDAFGLLLVLPLTRPLLRGVLVRAILRRVVVSPLGGTPGAHGPGTGRRPGQSGGGEKSGPGMDHPGPRSEGPVIRGEVVDDD